MRIARGATAVVLTMGLTGVLTGAVTAGTAAAALGPAAPADVVRWSPALADGDAVGVQVTRDGARLAPDRIRPPVVAQSSDGPTDAHPPGLLTLPARPVGVPVDRVEVSVDAVGAAPVGGSGATVDVDVRGLRAQGGWTEWRTAQPAARTPATPAPAATPATLQVALPAPVTQVQARLVLGPSATPGDTSPLVRGVTLAAYAAPPSVHTQTRTPAQHSRVFATREGLVGGTTANGHVITAHDLFVALPSRRALAPRNTGDYTVEVCAATGRCAYAPVWDVGPWNTRDDYWNPSNRRENWGDLSQGTPEAQAAATQGYHGGKDQFGRVVRNPAGIDLADGAFWDALGLTNNAWVTADYLWTGDSPLATVPGRADLHAAPKSSAPVVGLVAKGAAVPLQCVTGKWLRVAAGQFLPVTAVPRAQWPGNLPRCR